MKRNTWIIVSLAALFGLRAPLCVFACMDAASTAYVTPMEQHQGETAPCHGPGSTYPQSPAPIDHECDCDRTQVVLSKGDPKNASGALEVPSPPLAVVWAAAPGYQSSSAWLWRRHQSLPPPDILLLKSTLLL